MGFRRPTTVDLTASERAVLDLTALADHAPPGASRPKVLLVDDEPRNRDWFRRMLEIQGWEGLLHVSEAGTAEESIVAGAQFRPDVVVLDQHVPGASGRGWARTLREQHPGATLLMFSAVVDHETQAEAAALEMQAISKIDHGGISCERVT